MEGLISFPEGKPCATSRCTLTISALVTILLLQLSAVPASAQDTISTGELKQHSLEELMEMQVTSFSKRAQRAFDVPAAIEVITSDEIRRSGATSIPEALGLATNLNVAQIDASSWAISARGFNSTASNKLLVLIDGRSVYTPLYSGVFWDIQNVFLEDVDRIEVITGPGGIVWGSNAVNGVINIITKGAADVESKGALVTARGGSREVSGGIHYAGALSDAASYRVYFTGFRKDDTRLPDHDRADDHWTSAQGGFKTGWEPTERGELTLQGDAYTNSNNQQLQPNAEASGGNLLGKWTNTLGVRSEYSIQMYYDLTHRMIPGIFTEDLGTLDIDAQYRFSLDASQDVTWGVGFRYMNDRVATPPLLAFLPDNLLMRLYSAFVQDEILLFGERGKLTVGSKFEHNDFSGYEIQPGARFSWSFSSSQMAWAGVTRAVRTPSRIDRDFFVPATPPYLLAGGSGFLSERSVAYEAGYRTRPANQLSLDLTVYYDVYDDLRSFEPGPPFTIQNGLEGTTYGTEVAVNYRLMEWWGVQASYAYFQKDIRLKPWSRDINGGQGEGNDPRHSIRVSSSMDLPGNVEADLFVRGIDELPDFIQQVPSYVEADLRLAWNARNDLTLSIVGQNLLHDQHPEFGMPASRREIPRGIYASMTWHQ